MAVGGTGVLVGAIVGCGLLVAVGRGVSVTVGEGVGLGGSGVIVGVVVGSGVLVGLGVLVNVGSTTPTTAVALGVNPEEEFWLKGSFKK